jgi:predicted small metal-binding protein
MKHFDCGSVFAGCDTTFRGLDEGGIADRAAEHAVAAHGASADEARAQILANIS